MTPRAAVWAIVAILICGMAALISQMARTTAKAVPAVREMQLDRACKSVEMTLDGLGDSGYARWTPSAAAATLVQLLNTSMEDADEEMRRHGMEAPLKLGQPITYGLDLPSQPWQVVLIPAEKHGIIRVECYGEDVNSPLYTEDLRVPAY